MHPIPAFSDNYLWLLQSPDSNRAAVVDAPLRDLLIRARDWFVEGGFALTVWQRPLSPAALDGTQTPAATLAASRALMVEAPCNGFWHGRAGVEQYVAA